MPESTCPYTIKFSKLIIDALKCHYIPYTRTMWLSQRGFTVHKGFRGVGFPPLGFVLSTLAPGQTPSLCVDPLVRFW